MPRRTRGGIIALVGIFVADLPADHVGLVAQRLDHAAYDVAAEGAVARTGDRELPAAAMADHGAIALDAQDVGIFLAHPRRRRVGGRADDDLDVVFGREPDGADQPVHVVFALARLHPAPGEFADPHDIGALRLHQLQVIGPAVLGPLFGIPGRAEPQPLELHGLRGRGRSGRSERGRRQSERRQREEGGGEGLHVVGLPEVGCGTGVPGCWLDR